MVLLFCAYRWFGPYAIAAFLDIVFRVTTGTFLYVTCQWAVLQQGSEYCQGPD